MTKQSPLPKGLSVKGLREAVLNILGDADGSGMDKTPYINRVLDLFKEYINSRKTNKQHELNCPKGKVIGGEKWRCVCGADKQNQAISDFLEQLEEGLNG